MQDWFLILFSGIVTSIGLAITPGPHLFLTIYEGATKGRKAAIAILVGVFVGTFFILVPTIYRLRMLVANNVVNSIISIIGGGVLIVLAVNNFFLRKENGVYSSKSDNKANLFKNFIKGIAVTVFNPLAISWWLFVGSKLFQESMERKGDLGVVVLLIGFILSGAITFNLIINFAVKGCNLIEKKLYRIALRSTSLFLFAMGVYFVFTGVKNIIIV